MGDLKILVCGDVKGSFRVLFSKVRKINKKNGPYDYLFCVGNFFDEHSDEWKDLRLEKIKVPIRTYILGPNDSRHEKFYNIIDSIPNLTYIGKSGVFTGLFGFKIAYLSGVQDENKKPIPVVSKYSCEKKKQEQETVLFSEKHLLKIINIKPKADIDILLTSQWPKFITNHAVSLPSLESSVDKIVNGSPQISKLAQLLTPRYHFCGLAGLYYERVPYRNHQVMQEDPKTVTRFCALAPVNNTEKQKWLYSLIIKPQSLMSKKQITELPAFSTSCPYEFKITSKQVRGSDMSDEEFFLRTAIPTTSRKRSREDEYSENLSIDSSSCFFCFASFDSAKHRLISAGSHCYVKLAKGILVPEHVVIVPIEHSDHSYSPDEVSSDVFEEIENFKKSLAYYFHNKKKQDVVFFERHVSGSHRHIQVIPVPKKINYEIRCAIIVASKQHDFEFEDIDVFHDFQEILQQKHPNKPFAYFQVMENYKSTAKYLFIIKKGKLPRLFGRTVLACPNVLNVPDRIDWKKCVESKSVEAEMAEEMRKTFEPYDFTNR